MTRVDRLREDGWTECACDGCPDSTHGLIPPDGMVLVAAKAMEPLAPNAPLRWYAMARAALVAAARWEAPE